MDIRTPERAAILHDLLRTAGVFVENRTPGPSAVPARLGARTDAVLLALGRTGEEIEALRQAGVVA